MTGRRKRESVSKGAPKFDTITDCDRLENGGHFADDNVTKIDSLRLTVFVGINVIECERTSEQRIGTVGNPDHHKLAGKDLSSDRRTFEADASSVSCHHFVFDNRSELLKGGRHEARQIEKSRVILWQGHCSVHAMFRPEHVDAVRANLPGVKVLVHPECPMEVVDKADLAGSTSFIIKQVEAAPPGTTWAIGTELHLVKRLEQQHPEQTIRFLSPVVCMCATMYRIDLAHLCWSLEHVDAGNPVNVIRVDDETAKWAVTALERMLAVS